MKDSLYHSMDAPVAPIEKKIEALKPAEKACFALDLCVASFPDCKATLHRALYLTVHVWM